MDRKNQLLWRFFKINLAKVDDRNAWYLVLEIFWASILGSVATFNAAYAIRLGADNFQVSLLSSIPALVAVLVSFPAGVFLQRRRRRKPWVLGSLQVYRVGYLLVAAAPWMHFFGIQPGMMVVLILVMISIPGNIFNVGWTRCWPRSSPNTGGRRCLPRATSSTRLRSAWWCSCAGSG